MSANVRKIIYWNGRDLPPGMSALPVGLYAIEAQDDVSPETLTALRDARDAIERGEGVDHEVVDRELRAALTHATKPPRW